MWNCPCIVVYAHLVLSYGPLPWSMWEPGQSLGPSQEGLYWEVEEGVNCGLPIFWVDQKQSSFRVGKRKLKIYCSKKRKIWISSWYHCQQSGKIHEDTAFIALCCRVVRVRTAWVEQGRRGNFEAPCHYRGQEVKPQGFIQDSPLCLVLGHHGFPFTSFELCPSSVSEMPCFLIEWSRWLAQLV